jgi:hypothetical protein
MTIDHLPRFRALPIVLACLISIATACTPAPEQATPTAAPTSADLAQSTGSGATGSAGVTSSPGSLAARPTSAPTPTPTPTATPVEPSASPGTAKGAVPPDRKPFAMNLARRADFVAQYTFEWCVGASLQMALNMSTDESRTTRADQQRLWEMARDRSSSPFGGANPRGWVASLNDLGVGPYVLVSLPSFDDAISTAARAIRDTRRPVGLVMWRGRHAWVMSGFEATADPRRFDDFAVKRVRVHDPLYPHGSSVWGRSPRPNSLVTLDTLAKQFVIRDHGRVDLGVPPGWLLVLPVSEA